MGRKLETKITVKNHKKQASEDCSTRWNIPKKQYTNFKCTPSVGYLGANPQSTVSIYTLRGRKRVRRGRTYGVWKWKNNQELKF